MQWTDEAIVLGVRRHGEGSAIVELMTREHGRHLGLVRGGSGVRLRPVLQPGNTVEATWRARLDEHLGTYAIEGLVLRAASVLTVPHAVYGVTHLAGLCRLLPERDPHGIVYNDLEMMLERLDDPLAVAGLVARFERDLLAELGFGLDLSSCAATGTIEDLTYVSPKSGRAVSRDAGAAWSDRLLRLPAFLREDDMTGASGETPSAADIADAFVLMEFFLVRYVFDPRGAQMPMERGHFLAAALRGHRPVLAAG
jgi:DNA repair protein RecO (recombination protein O)